MKDTEHLPKEWTLQKKKPVKGGQASVFKVKHQDEREGAFRTIKDISSAGHQDRFHRELSILTEKINHRGIVKLLDWTKKTDEYWYISELGDPFDNWWKEVKSESTEQPETLVRKGVAIVREILSALVDCHDNNVIHRDIKPKNIIMKRGVENTWPILIDFGIAFDNDKERLTTVEEAVGNARFSPDVMRNRMEEVEPWLDIFDVGQLLIWMLDIKPPKDHWQRPVHWKYAVYSNEISSTSQSAIRAFTASCSNQETAPANAKQALSLLNKLFPTLVPESVTKVSATPCKHMI